jgi:hypothetical protein
MSNEDEKKIRELEKEFRDAVVDELKMIKHTQNNIESCVEKLDKKLDLNIQKLEFELKTLALADADRAATMESMEKRYEEHRIETNERIKKLEAPVRALKLITNTILAVGGVAGSIYAIGKLVLQLW